MCLIFPEEAPRTREDVLNFIKANLPGLKSRCAAIVEARMKDVTMEDIDQKWKKASHEYGHFNMFGIHAQDESHQEMTDLVSYFAIEVLQMYFRRNENNL